MPARRNFRPLPKNNSQRIRSKQGWRIIGGQRAYFRSKQEANHARYLEFLKQCGIIARWEHESKTFWFTSIKRGINNYTPDFEILLPDGKIEYHEVKGWMDSRSKTKINRFRKFYPNETLKVFDIKTCTAIAKKLSKIVKDWE
jgi:hypothetical protein